MREDGFDKRARMGYIEKGVWPQGTCGMMTRRSERRGRVRAWVAGVCSVAFVGAVNYCDLEAFAACPAHTDDSHHAAEPAHHHGESPATPASHHEQESLTCCAAMQAVTAPKVAFQLASSPAWRLQPLVLGSSWITSLLEPSRPASGVSPPTREPPPPARPFYRTTYANHAPPVCLA